MTEASPAAQGASLVMVIEDEPNIAALLRIGLQASGYNVAIVPDGSSGLALAERQRPDLVVLDRGLPGMDGLEVCRRLRLASNVPILMLTAKGETHDRVEGLDAGADDYVVKPFEIDELLARVRALLRRRSPAPDHGLLFADLSLSEESRLAARAGRAIVLAPREFELLRFLLQHARTVLARERILLAVWGDDFEGSDNVLDVYVRTLRRKLGEPRLIHTVHGVGYVLREPLPEEANG